MSQFWPLRRVCLKLSPLPLIFYLSSCVCLCILVFWFLWVQIPPSCTCIIIMPASNQTHQSQSNYISLPVTHSLFSHELSSSVVFSSSTWIGMFPPVPKGHQYPLPATTLHLTPLPQADFMTLPSASIQPESQFPSNIALKLINK